MPRFGIAVITCLCLATWSNVLSAQSPQSSEPPSAAELSTNVPWLEALAAQGNAKAQFNLGVLHDTGQGVWKDHVVAAQWYRRAARQGHAAAQFNLGGMYFEGQGVPKDLVRASLWFTLAAVAGFEGAARNRNSVATLLTAEQLTHVQQRARDCRLNNYLSCE